MSLLNYRINVHSIILTPLRSMASCSSCTTSLPTTFEQLKPFVHLSKIPFVRPFCDKGKLNVKPNGSFSRTTFSSFMNFAKQSAIWSNNCKTGGAFITSKAKLVATNLFAWAQHNVLWYSKNFRFHFKMLLAQFYQ